MPTVPLTVSLFPGLGRIGLVKTKRKTHILVIFQEYLEVSVLSEDGVGGESLKKNFMNLHSLLKNSKIFPARIQCFKCIHVNRERKRKMFNFFYSDLNSRLKFLLHFGIFLLCHARFPLSQFLHLLSGTLKVRFWWGRRNLKNMVNARQFHSVWDLLVIPTVYNANR